MTPQERDQLALRDPDKVAQEIVDRAGPLPSATRAGLLDDIEAAIGRRDFAIREALGYNDPLREWRHQLRISRDARDLIARTHTSAEETQ